MTRSPIDRGAFLAADAHVLSRPRGRCRDVRRRFRAQVALGAVSLFALAVLCARALFAVESAAGF